MVSHVRRPTTVSYTCLTSTFSNLINPTRHSVSSRPTNTQSEKKQKKKEKKKKTD
ncbi:unnamed protein product [Prunus brigantina]